MQVNSVAMGSSHGQQPWAAACVLLSQLDNKNTRFDPPFATLTPNSFAT
jgi:hypothetical protein